MTPMEFQEQVTDMLKNGGCCLAMSGHRYILPSALEAVKRGTGEVLELLRTSRFTSCWVLTGMAVGADRRVTEAVLQMKKGYPEWNARVVAVLPMPWKIYEGDFDAEELLEFRRLMEQVDMVVEIPLEPICQQWLEQNPGQPLPGKRRMYQYGALGEFLVQYGTCLLALWDGLPVEWDENGQIPCGEMGSTADVVRMAFAKRKWDSPELPMPILEQPKSLRNLPVEEFPPVIQVAAPRIKKGAERFAEGLVAGEVRAQMPKRTE